jgi:outer membrane murein-binding lipoprotein Lpp
MSGAGNSNSEKADTAQETGTALVIAADDTSSAEATAATATGPSRATMAAAGIGFIAGAALLVAAGGAMGVGHLLAKSTQAPAAMPVASSEAQTLKKAVAKLETQVTALKANLETASRQAKTQRTRITERYEHAARTQTEMQARIAKINEAVDRLDKRVSAAAATEITGSVAPRYAAAAAATQPAPAAAKPVAQRPILRGWVIRSIFNGRAIVASRRGAFEAAPGLYVPGLGQVETITRQGNRWVVVAEKGIIRSMQRLPRPRAAFELDELR